MSKETLRISGIVEESIVDGRGIRYVIFTQGCPHRCPGCQNPATHDFAGGRVVETASLLPDILADPMLRGVTFSGGEPFCQAAALTELAKEIRARSKLDITVFTGYTWEELQTLPGARELLEQTDVLIDGRFVEAEKDLTLQFRGSRNQRIIDVPRSLAAGEVCLL